MTTVTRNTNDNTIIRFPRASDAGPMVTAHTAPSQRRARRNAAAGHRNLERMLRRMACLAPEAPLSLLLVRFDDAPKRDEVKAAATMVSETLRPTDFVCIPGESHIGVVLQGTGSGRAGRLAWQLERKVAQSGYGDVRVAAATGTGANGLALIEAAGAGFEDAANS